MYLKFYYILTVTGTTAYINLDSIDSIFHQDTKMKNYGILLRCGLTYTINEEQHSHLIIAINKDGR